MSAFDLIDAKLKQQAQVPASPIADAFKQALYNAGRLGDQQLAIEKRKPGRPRKEEVGKR